MLITRIFFGAGPAVSFATMGPIFLFFDPELLVAVEPKTTASAASVKSTEAVSTVPVKSPETVTNQPAGTLYAQAIANGYQLIDTTPKIVLTLLKTSVENYFIAGNATANGIVLKKKEDWFFEYYKDGKLISEKLLVKF